MLVQVRYGDAIVALQEEISKDVSKWAYPDVSFGTDLQVDDTWLGKGGVECCVFLFFQIFLSVSAGE